MKHVIVGGEAVPPRLFAAASSIVPRSALVNGYGPTENTTFSCCFRLDCAPDGLRSVPIGAPITGSGAVVVDANLRLLATGLPGEILVTGAGLAVGYVNDRELTSQRFIALSAFGGMRAYRTGDLGRLLPDGALEYLGRLDRQLKIRGFRIEPGEVEAILAKHPTVHRCAAYADEFGGVKTLVAGVEAAGVSEAELKTWLGHRLPPFMVPTRIRIVDRLPVTANGKLDIAALRATQPADEDAGTPPAGPVERASCEIAAQLLGLSTIAPDDDLFALGANSMTAIQLAAQLTKRIGSLVPANWVFESRTPRALANRIEAPSAKPHSEAPPYIIKRAARVRKPPRH